MYIILISLSFIVITRFHNLQGLGGGVRFKPKQRVKEIRANHTFNIMEFDKGLQRKKKN